MLAVNRARPNAFTVENWRRALRTETIVGPIDSLKPKSGRRSIVIVEAPAAIDPDDIPAEQVASSEPRQVDDETSAGELSGSGFDCHDGLCIAVHGSGAIVAHAANIRAARRACDYASLIVIEDATAKNVCSTGPPLILTKRELAKQGSAVVYFSNDETGQMPEVRFALSEPYRPWHAQRRFSREARGMPPYERKLRAFTGTKFPWVKEQPAQDADYASLIVIEDATAKNVCSTGPPLILTKRELAKQGSAAVYFSNDETGQMPEVRFALSEPYRPWHAQRRFSREARGMPPYERKLRAFTGTKFPWVKEQPAQDAGPSED